MAHDDLNAIIRIGGVAHNITRTMILGVARFAEPMPPKYVLYRNWKQKYPPKQLIRLSIGTDKQFNSTNARSLLTRLGFTVKALQGH